MEKVLDVRDLRMRYGTTDVLDGVSFTAQRGEVLALLGPNGAGKTTTIEIIEGFRLRSADQLSRRVVGESEIRWTRAGSRYVHAAEDATGFVRELFLQYGEDIADLEVRRASLEDTYMSLVRDFEAGRGATAAAAFAVTR